MGTPSAIVLTNATGLPFAGIDAAAVVTAAEAISANNNDTTIPTSAAVYNVSGRVLLASKTASASASLSFTEFDNAVYRYYEFVLENVKPATDAVGLLMRFSTDAGATYDAGASDYTYGLIGLQVTSSVTQSTSAGNGRIELTFNADVGNAAGERGVSGQLTLFNPGLTTEQTRIKIDTVWHNPLGVITTATGHGVRLADQDTNAVRFLFGSGNIASGTIRLYGILQ